MINFSQIDSIVRRLGDLVPEALHPVRDELNTALKSALYNAQQTFQLVTREEFEVQRALLLRTREKIEALEQQLALLSGQHPPNQSQPANTQEQK